MTNWADPYLKMTAALRKFSLYAELGEWDRALSEWNEVGVQQEWLDTAIQCNTNARELRERASRPSAQSCGDTAVREDE